MIRTKAIWRRSNTNYLGCNVYISNPDGAEVKRFTILVYQPYDDPAAVCAERVNYWLKGEPYRDDVLSIVITELALFMNQQ